MEYEAKALGHDLLTDRTAGPGGAVEGRGDTPGPQLPKLLLDPAPGVADHHVVGAEKGEIHGELMVKAAAAKGVDISRMRKVPGKTAVTQVELQDGERVFCGYDACGQGTTPNWWKRSPSQQRLPSSPSMAMTIFGPRA